MNETATTVERAAPAAPADADRGRASSTGGCSSRASRPARRRSRSSCSSSSRAGRRTRTRRCRCSSAGSRSATCSTSCSASAAAPRCTSCSPGWSRTPAAACTRCASSRRCSRSRACLRSRCSATGSPAGGPALAATALAAASWMLLFHGIYARMYSLFLLLSTLSYLALLRALDRGGARAWTLWAVTMLLCIGTHPYGALVLGSQGLYVLVTRARLRQAVPAFAAVLVLAIPFWRSSIVLADRFDVGVGGGGGGTLRTPGEVLRYLWHVAGDSSAGYTGVLVARAPARARRPRAPRARAPAERAARGLRRRSRRRSSSSPAGSAATPPRVAAPDLRAAVLRPRRRRRDRHRHAARRAAAAAWLAAIVVAALLPVGGRLGLAQDAGALQAREPRRASARGTRRRAGSPRRPRPTTSSSPTSRSTSRPGSVAARPSRGRSSRAPTRSSPCRRFESDEAARPRRLGLRRRRQQQLRQARPRSSSGCRSRTASSRARVYGPYLVIRTRRPTVTVDRYLDDARKVELIGKSLGDGRRGHQLRDDPPRSGPVGRPLPLQRLLVARRLFERGQPGRGAALRRPFATGSGHDRGRAEEPAEEEGAETRAATLTVHCSDGSGDLRPASASIRAAARASVSPSKMNGTAFGISWNGGPSSSRSPPRRSGRSAPGSHGRRRAPARPLARPVAGTRARSVGPRRRGSRRPETAESRPSERLTSR